MSKHEWHAAPLLGDERVSVFVMHTGSEEHHFIRSMAAEPGLDRDDVLVAVTTLSFDIAGLELFLPLAAGGRGAGLRGLLLVTSARL